MKAQIVLHTTHSSPRRVNVFQFWLSQEIGCMPGTPVGIVKTAPLTFITCSSGTAMGGLVFATQADQLVESLQLSARSRGLGGTCEDLPRLWGLGSAKIIEIIGYNWHISEIYRTYRIYICHEQQALVHGDQMTRSLECETPSLIDWWCKQIFFLTFGWYKISD